MKFKRSQLAVYFIMGSNNCGKKDPLMVLTDALEGGITCFQFREKGVNAKTGNEKEALALRMKEICQRYRVPFIVNDDLMLALAVEADGIHVGQDDDTIEKIKAVVPADFVVGVSTTSEQEAVEAVAKGADYIGVGPIFTTDTKADAKDPIGLSGITAIRSRVNEIPIVAIGGIQLPDIKPIIQAGADGVSVISAISLADNPQEIAKLMLDAHS